MYVSSVFITDQSLICFPTVGFHMVTQNSEQVPFDYTAKALFIRSRCTMVFENIEFDCPLYLLIT